MHPVSRSFWTALSGLTFLHCGGTPPPAQPAAAATAAPIASTSAPASSEPIAELKTGALPPKVVDTPIAGQLLDHCVSDQHEFLRIDLGTQWRTALDEPHAQQANSFWGAGFTPPLEVSAVSVTDRPNALGFVVLNDTGDPTLKQMQSSVGPPPPRDTLWIRREVVPNSTGASATLYVAAYDARPGYQFTVTVANGQTPRPCASLEQFSRALRRHFEAQPRSAFHEFAIERLARNFPTDRMPGSRHFDSDASAIELDGLMGLASGYESIEAALQRHHNLRIAVESKSLTVPLSKLTAPRLAPHPWVQMLAALHSAVPDEPLAKATPADFYWLRARNIEALYGLLDEIDSWLTPAYHLSQQRAERRLLRQRYETQLALRRSELGPAHQLVQEVAIVGSDPFLVMGSDLTLILRINSPTLLKNVAMDLSLAELEKEHGKTTATQFNHEGVPVTLKQSENLAIQRYSAELNGLTLISNSKGGISRVISAILGKIPSLATEPDFRYMLARDAQVKDDLLLYMGDRFIERAVTPTSRVLDARRYFAQSELARPGYASLLYGWLLGREPSVADLAKNKLLVASELKHFDGQPIRFSVGDAARSTWGTVRAMTPLIDLPAPTRVSPQERDAYQRFVSHYEGLWSEAVDPIALRIRFEQRGEAPIISGKLRILPIVRNSDYRDLQELVGDARLVPGARSDGARIVFGIAKDSELKRELGGLSQGFLGKDVSISWIGDYAMLGGLDRPSLANALTLAREAPQVPSSESRPRHAEERAIAQLPLYAAVEVTSASATSLALGVLRKQIEDNSIQWQPEVEYRKIKIHQVRLSDLDGVSLFYAIGRKTLFVTLSLSVLQRLLDDELDDKGPKAVASGTPGAEGQFALDVAGVQGGGLLTSLIWLLEKELRDNSSRARSRAEAVFRGAPKTANDAEHFKTLTLRYFGAIPVTPDGSLYQLSSQGVSDVARGTAHAPRWPALPVPQSDAERVFRGFTGLRTQLAFDREPSVDPQNPQTSLAVSVEIERRKPQIVFSRQ
jgi:hypothetical protein